MMHLRPTRATLLGAACAVALAACQTYTGKPKTDTTPAGDVRPTRDVRKPDQATRRDGAPGRDAVGETRPALEGGLPDSAPPDTCGALPTCPILFTLDKGSESTAEVRGSFNGWGAVPTPMTLVGSQWQATITLTHADSVQYKFFLDGKTWVKDPKNPKSSGPPDYNSVLDVVCPSSCGG